MEDKHGLQLQSMREEKEQLRVLVSRQGSVIAALEQQLASATVNSSALQRQQHHLMDTVHGLLALLASATRE